MEGVYKKKKSDRNKQLKLILKMKVFKYEKQLYCYHQSNDDLDKITDDY